MRRSFVFVFIFRPNLSSTVYILNPYTWRERNRGGGSFKINISGDETYRTIVSFLAERHGYRKLLLAFHSPSLVKSSDLHVLAFDFIPQRATSFGRSLIYIVRPWQKTWEGHLVRMSLPSSSFDDSREGERELYCVPAKDCEYGVRPGWKTWVVRCVFPMATTHYSVFRPGHTWIIIVSCVVVFVHIINIDNSSIAPSYDLICEFLQLCFCNQKLPYVISST